MHQRKEDVDDAGCADLLLRFCSDLEPSLWEDPRDLDDQELRNVPFVCKAEYAALSQPKFRCLILCSDLETVDAQTLSLFYGCMQQRSNVDNNGNGDGNDGGGQARWAQECL